MPKFLFVTSAFSLKLFDTNMTIQMSSKRFHCLPTVKEAKKVVLDGSLTDYTSSKFRQFHISQVVKQSVSFCLFNL